MRRRILASFIDYLIYINVQPPWMMYLIKPNCITSSSLWTEAHQRRHSAPKKYAQPILACLPVPLGILGTFVVVVVLVVVYYPLSTYFPFSDDTDSIFRILFYSFSRTKSSPFSGHKDDPEEKFYPTNDNVSHKIDLFHHFPRNDSHS